MFIEKPFPYGLYPDGIPEIVLGEGVKEGRISVITTPTTIPIIRIEDEFGTREYEAESLPDGKWIARALKAASKRLDEKQGISPKVRLRIVYGHDSEG
jgi:hypothetical protein